MGSSGRGRALTMVNRGVGLGWGGWVRGLFSEKRASEMEGIKAGYYCHFVRTVSVAVGYGYSCWSNYTTTHGCLGVRYFFDPLALLGWCLVV